MPWKQEEISPWKRVEQEHLTFFVKHTNTVTGPNSTLAQTASLVCNWDHIDSYCSQQPFPAAFFCLWPLISATFPGVSPRPFIVLGLKWLMWSWLFLCSFGLFGAITPSHFHFPLYIWRSAVKGSALPAAGSVCMLDWPDWGSRSGGGLWNL